MSSVTSERRTTAQGAVTSARASALLLPLIAVCTAVTAANIYLAAPLLPLIAHDFGSAPAAWPGSPRWRSSATRPACSCSPRSATS